MSDGAYRICLYLTRSLVYRATHVAGPHVSGGHTNHSHVARNIEHVVTRTTLSPCCHVAATLLLRSYYIAATLHKVCHAHWHATCYVARRMLGGYPQAGRMGKGRAMLCTPPHTHLPFPNLLLLIATVAK